MAVQNEKLRQQLINQIAVSVAKKMQLKIVPSSLNSATPGGRQLGYIDWGGIVTGLINTAATTYSTKELQKTQAALANKLAEAEAKKLLALTELELAKAQTAAEQNNLIQKQNELQQILKDVQFTNVQKWLLGGAGLLAFVLGAIQLSRMAKAKPRAR